MEEELGIFDENRGAIVDRAQNQFLFNAKARFGIFRLTAVPEELIPVRGSIDLSLLKLYYQ